MEKAINQIQQLVQRYENDKSNWLKFYDSEKFQSTLVEGTDVEAIKNSASSIYDELIDELNQAIEVLRAYSKALQWEDN